MGPWVWFTNSEETTDLRRRAQVWDVNGQTQKEPTRKCLGSAACDMACPLSSQNAHKDTGKDDNLKKTLKTRPEG